ncbi:hypothetical protein AB0G02_16585 [Actinosynnema sp. NPDC023658]|uniref:hypothetical protein n=1 Tax=Actinosynnema sp. NPDC023658 TaxID=3155465 RepID=UPI00340CDC7A
MTRVVEDACGDHLQDDAAVLCLDWHGTNRTELHADNGADMGPASPAGRLTRSGKTTGRSPGLHG